MQTIKIDVTKIEKSAIYIGEKGKYITVTLMDNRDGTDQYGNDGFAVQDIGKERRLAGEKGPIIGNWKHVGPTQAKPAPKPPAPAGDDCDEIPF
jgi:hypothetical protein